MDSGYVITEDAQTALDAFHLEGVRHVAALANGEGFVAFDGPAQPCPGALLLADGTDDGWWQAIKRIAPTEGQTEAFYLLSEPRFLDLHTNDFTAATVLTTGNVLVETDGSVIDGVIWGSVATSWLDERVPVA